jgi:hypothetical protein
MALSLSAMIKSILEGLSVNGYSAWNDLLCFEVTLSFIFVTNLIATKNLFRQITLTLDLISWYFLRIANIEWIKLFTIWVYYNLFKGN